MDKTQHTTISRTGLGLRAQGHMFATAVSLSPLSKLEALSFPGMRRRNASARKMWSFSILKSRYYHVGGGGGRRRTPREGTRGGFNSNPLRNPVSLDCAPSWRLIMSQRERESQGRERAARQDEASPRRARQGKAQTGTPASSQEPNAAKGTICDECKIKRGGTREKLEGEQ